MVGFIEYKIFVEGQFFDQTKLQKANNRLNSTPKPNNLFFVSGSIDSE